jgi:hypothetical protein
VFVRAVKAEGYCHGQLHNPDEDRQNSCRTVVSGITAKGRDS